jgi:thiol-disulfide isomerase/thioredoxin
MSDFQHPGDHEESADTDADEKGHHMSSRPKDPGQVQPDQPESRQRLMLRFLAGIIGALVVVAIIVYAVLQENRAVPGSAVATDTQQLPPSLTAGMRAPDFQVPSQIGAFSSSSLAGTPYLLEIFATWCPHCQRMTKVLREIRSQVPESKLSMLSVTGSPYAANSTPDNLVPENQGDVDKFESTYGVSWPTLLDTDLIVAKKFGLDGFPTIFIVDPKGTIVYATSGEVSLDTLMNAIHRAGG